MARSKQVPRGRRYKNSRALSSSGISASLHFCVSALRSAHETHHTVPSQPAKASQAFLVNVRPVVECLTSGHQCRSCSTTAKTDRLHRLPGKTHLPIFVSSISRSRPRIADSQCALERRTTTPPATRSYAAESFTGHRFEALRSKYVQVPPFTTFITRIRARFASLVNVLLTASSGIY